jgi:glycine betaine/proline transport system ATP-binding protein
MNPLGVLTARDVMDPGAEAGAAATVDAETPVREVMAALEAAPGLTVAEAGRPLGRVTRESVLARLGDGHIG